MKRFSYIAVMLLFMACISEKGMYTYLDPEYEYDDGHKNCYIVDTIYIDSPIIVATKEGHDFTMSKSVFESYNGRKSFFYNNPNVYLFQTNVPIKNPKLKYPPLKTCYDYTLLDYITKDGVEVYTYKYKPDYFLLLLVNGDYFNRIYRGIDGPPTLELKNKKFSGLSIKLCK